MSDYKPIEKLDYTFYKWIHISKNLDDLCYVGSTANMISRKAQHKKDCNSPNNKNYNILLYKTIREYGGFNNFKMVILGTAEQITKREAQAIEEQYRVAEKATLNMVRCYTTDEQKKEQKKQYYEDNKQKLIEKAKKYRQENKADVLEKAKKYYQENRELMLEKSKQYTQAHKEQVKEKRKQYTQANKELVKEKRKQYRQAKKAKETQAEETQAKETILTEETQAEETQYLKEVKKPEYRWIWFVKVI